MATNDGRSFQQTKLPADEASSVQRVSTNSKRLSSVQVFLFVAVALSALIFPAVYYHSELLQLVDGVIYPNPLRTSIHQIELRFDEDDQYPSQHFSVRNNSKFPVSLTGVKMPCSCMFVEPLPVLIGPNSAVDLVMSLDSTGYKGRISFDDTALIYSDIGQQIEISLRVVGTRDAVESELPSDGGRFEPIADPDA